MAKLGEVCKVSPSTKNIERQGAWLLNLDMVEQQTGRVIEYKYVGEDDLNGSIIQFDTENVLYSKLRPNLNKVVLPQKDGFSTSELLPLRPDARVLNRDYLAVFLRSDSFVTWAVSKTAGAKMPRLGTKDLMSAEIPVPTIEQQKKIAEKFKKLEQLISLRKQQLAKLDELVKARFVEMFGEPIGNPMGWKRVRFDSISENLDSKRVPVTESDRKDGVYPYYGASGIVDWINDYIFDEDILLVSEDGANLLMRSTPIAFSVSGKSWVNNHAHVVRFHDFATQKFIEVYFSLIDISEYITGTAQPKLNQAKLNTMLFCWPPLSLQKQFAAFVERVDQQKQTVQQSFEKLELMKKALMQEYFG